jgi:predicted GNAT family acetyltransferase
VSVDVADNRELARYEVRVDGQLAGFAQYRLAEDRITIFHAEVDPDYEGQGIGSQLAKSALDDVAARGLELNPRCPFIAGYVRRHPDPYLGIVAGPLRERVMAGAHG